MYHGGMLSASAAFRMVKKSPERNKRKKKMIINIKKLDWGWCLYWNSAIKIAEYRNRVDGESPNSNIDFELLIRKTEERFLALRGIMPWWHGLYSSPKFGERMNKMLEKSKEYTAWKILKGEVKFTY